MTTLRARLDLTALAANTGLALAGLGERAIADLRRDAWGHGIAPVARVLADAGVRAAVVDPGDRAAATAAGLTATEAGPTLDGGLLFGMPGSAGAPVLRVSARVLSIKRLLAGEGVSYGYTHRADADTRIALIDGGYGQGIVRTLGNRIDVEAAGTLRPVVGRIAMDVCVVDIGTVSVEPGDEVVYFGGTGPARGALATWEAASGMCGAELVCAIGLRARPAESA